MAWRAEGPWLIFIGIVILRYNTFTYGISMKDGLEKTESPDVDRAFI